MITEDWRLLTEEHTNPHVTMAIEEAILACVNDNSALNTIRFWKNRNCISIGRFQCPIAEICFDSCKKYETVVIRRLSGGGTVYQDIENLNFSIFCNCTSGMKAKSEIFSKMSLIIQKSLKKLRIDSQIDGTSLLVRNRKISGVAGTVLKRGVLVHSSILINSNLEILSEVLKLNQQQTKKGIFIRSQRREVTSLNKELGHFVESNKVQNAIVQSLQEIFKLNLTRSGLSKSEFYLMQKLQEFKYSRSQWNLLTCFGCPEEKKDLPILRTAHSVFGS